LSIHYSILLSTFALGTVPPANGASKILSMKMVPIDDSESKNEFFPVELQSDLLFRNVPGMSESWNINQSCSILRLSAVLYSKRIFFILYITYTIYSTVFHNLLCFLSYKFILYINYLHYFILIYITIIFYFHYPK
jgi:hypothetical protein